MPKLNLLLLVLAASGLRAQQTALPTASDIGSRLPQKLQSLATPRSDADGAPVFVYDDNAPGCGHLYADGLYVQIINAGRLVVMASPTDTGKKLIIHVGVFNRDDRPYDLLPSNVEAMLVEPKSRVLKQEDAMKLAKSIQSGAERWSRWDAALAGMATQQISTQSNTSGQISTNTEYYGQYGQRVGEGRGRGGYSEQTTTTTTVPNVATQQQAQQRIQSRMANAAAQVNSIMTEALRPRTIGAGANAGGDVYFERDGAIGKKNKLAVRVSIAGARFVFRFERK